MSAPFWVIPAISGGFGLTTASLGAFVAIRLHREKLLREDDRRWDKQREEILSEMDAFMIRAVDHFVRGIEGVTNDEQYAVWRTRAEEIRNDGRFVFERMRIHSNGGDPGLLIFASMFTVEVDKMIEALGSPETYQPYQNHWDIWTIQVKYRALMAEDLGIDRTTRGLSRKQRKAIERTRSKLRSMSALASKTLSDVQEEIASELASQGVKNASPKGKQRKRKRWKS